MASHGRSRPPPPPPGQFRRVDRLRPPPPPHETDGLLSKPADCEDSYDCHKEDIGSSKVCFEGHNRDIRMEDLGCEEELKNAGRRGWV
ncbi:hypothetical protein IFR05_011969, partial [Cadophora sp. M221]